MRMIRRRGGRVAAAFLATSAALAVAAASVSAHPLGNFTINHYAGLRVGTQAIALDVVLDFAEIPAFSERQRIDADGDGIVSATEVMAEQTAACPRLASSLALAVDARAVPLRAVAAGLTQPPGVGGLPTLRLVCQYQAALAAPLTGTERVSFEDRSFAERIGWREIVVLGDATTVSGTGFSVAGASERLTAYPADLLASPLDHRAAVFAVTPGGPALPAFAAPDATPLPSTAIAVPAPVVPRPVPSAAAPTAASASPASNPAARTTAVGASSAPVAAPVAAPGAAPAAVAAAIPGGVTEDLASLIAVRDLTPLAIAGSLVVALALGALHALSPGHGKTVMAAYLVGSRGSTRHALALGLSVTVSHTIGVLALALLTVAGASVIAPEKLYPILGVISGTLVIAIGLWLLYGRFRALAIERAHEREHARAHATGLEHGHAHAHEHTHEREHEHEHSHGDEPEPDAHEHRHGPFRHSHVPTGGGVLTWRSLFTLGLAGGLVPSASALLLLLGSLSAGRPAYGIVLVVAFGLGMAFVLGGVGVLLVHAGRLLESVGTTQRWQRLWAWLPAATAVVVVGAGIWMTTSAIQTAF
jgi:ABC-type nickel/cobalt efflux system permease component RcnA